MLIRRIVLQNVKYFSGSTSIDLCEGKKEPHKRVVIYG
jgi:hypothetical protein